MFRRENGRVMARSIHRVLENLDGEFVTGDTSTDTIVCIDVHPGSEPRLDVEAHGLGAREKSISASIPDEDARALGEALIEAADRA